MENATKALTIAGGILISIIVIATLWYSFQQWGIFPSQKDESEETAQLIEFNNGFESYNKQNLYGADVITVLNKAIANNYKYGIENDGTDPYFVDVEFSIQTPVTGYTLTIEIDPKTKIVKTDKTYGSTAIVSIGMHGLTHDPNIVKSLCYESPVKRKKESPTKIIEDYPSVEEFKQRYFTCVRIEHNQQNGRVSKIVFRELSDSELNPIS